MAHIGLKVIGINPNHFLSQKNGLPFCDEKEDFQCFYCFMKWKEFNRIDNERWDRFFENRRQIKLFDTLNKLKSTGLH